MKKLTMLFAMLSVFVAVPGCGGKFPGDLWPALKACGAQDVSWADAARVFADLVEIVNGNPAGEADLLTQLASDVGGAIPCLVSYFQNQGGETGKAAASFRAGHAKEMKAAEARGPVSCNGRRPLTLEERAAIHISLQPAPTLTACDAKCGKPLTGLATHGRCLCWMESKTYRRGSRWVPVRELSGAGMVAAR